MPNQSSKSKGDVLGRSLMTAAVAIYGFVPVAVDLSPTHALHPDWTPHARMHLVWLVLTNFAVGLMALRLLWRRSRDRAALDLAGLLSLCVLGGFFASAAARSLYGGELSDPGGVPPVGPFDANILAFAVALALAATGWALARRASS
jgi:hypothetical protein